MLMNSSTHEGLEVTLSRKLYRTLSREGVKFRKAYARANWPTEFREVIKEWDFQYTPEQILNWYDTFAGSSFTPVICKPCTFIDKYYQIESNIAKNLIYSYWPINATEDDKIKVEKDKLFNEELFRRTANFWQQKAQTNDTVYKISAGIKYILLDGNMKLPALARALVYVVIRKDFEERYLVNGFYEEKIKPRNEPHRFAYKGLLTLGKKIIADGYKTPLEKFMEALEDKSIQGCRFGRGLEDPADRALADIIPDFDTMLESRVSEECKRTLKLG